jgi:hypothetical protein
VPAGPELQVHDDPDRLQRHPLVRLRRDYPVWRLDLQCPRRGRNHLCRRGPVERFLSGVTLESSRFIVVTYRAYQVSKQS